MPSLLKIILCILLRANGFATAETIQGKVVRVADGDTITVLDQAKIQHKIRLSGIDAPEIKLYASPQARKLGMGTRLYANFLLHKSPWHGHALMLRARRLVNLIAWLEILAAG